MKRKAETLNEARARWLLQIAVGIAWYLESTPPASEDEVMACAKQLVRALRRQSLDPPPQEPSA